MDTSPNAASPDDATRPPELDAAADTAGSVYNPFGTIGLVVLEPAPAASVPVQPAGGDLSLPVTATLAAFAFIGWMLREMVR